MKFHFSSVVILLLLTAFTSSVTQARSGPQGITLEGNILTSANLPEEAAVVNFTIQIKSPGVEGCLLYQESQVLNMSNSGGLFSLNIGSGSRSGSAYEATSTLMNAFNNSTGVVTGLTCASGSNYTPSTNDKRLVNITFDDGSGAQSITQALDVQTVPFAMYADTLQGRVPTDFIQINTTTKAVSQANLESVFDSSADVTALVSLINGTSSLYAQPGGSNAFTGSVSFSTPPTTTAAPSGGTSLVNKTYTDGSIAGKAIDSTTLAAITGNTLPSGDVLQWNGTNWVGAPSTDSSKLPLAGGTMTGAIAMGGKDITNAGYITIAGSHYLGLGAYTNAGEATLIGTLNATYAGVTWYNSTTNEIKYWNGASTVVLGASGAGLQSLNGLTSTTQIFANGSTGTAPAFASSGSTHTLNIPLAASAGTTAGLLSNADYTSFGKSILKDGTVSFTADQSMGSHKLTNVTDPASAQDAATKNYADTHAAGKNVATSLATAVTSSAGNGFVMTWDQTGNQWTAAAPAATGSVTSVNLALPSIFSVSGGPVTSSGTLTGTLATEAANSVFAGPTSGGAVAPTFRSLVAADVPNLDAAKITTGTLPVSRGGTGLTSYSNNALVMANGTGTALTSATCSFGEVLQWSGTAWACASITSGTVTSVTGTAPITVATGTSTPAISIATANTTTTGAISFGDWNLFNGKLSPTLSPANIFIGNASSVATGVAMSGDATIASSGALTLKNTGTAGTYSKVTTDAQGRVTSATNIGSSDVTTALGYAPLNKAGDTMSGALAMGGNDINATGNIGMSASKTLLLGTYTNTTEATLTGALTNTSVDIGKTWYNTSANQIKYWNGTTAVTLGAAGSGLQSLNGLTASTQTFANGTTGTAPAFVSASTTHTLNIPFASSASVTAGLLSNSDYIQIIRKDGTVAFTADESMGSHKLTNLTDPASAQDAATKNYSDTHAAGKNVATSLATAVTSSAGNGFVMTWDQTGNQWTAAAPAATGSVTSVNLALPSIFSVSGGPVTSSGTLTGTLATEAANSVFAGPTSGGAVAPTFRSLVAADVPNLDAAKITTGTLPVSRGGTGLTSYSNNALVMANGTGTALTSATCSFGEVLQWSGTAWACASITSGTVTSVTGTAPITVATGTSTPAISIATANTTTTGAISFGDWNLFNGKLSPTLSPANIFIGNASSVATGVAMSGDATIASSGALTLKNTGTAGTYSKVTTDAQGRVTSATNIGSSDVTTALGYTPLNKAGDTMSGALAMGGNDINATGNVGLSASKTLLLGTYTASAETTLTGALTNTSTDIGKTWYNTTSNQIKYWNGTTAITLGAAGSGLSSLNGLTGSSQTFANGSSGTAPAFSSSSTTHTLNIPLASSASVTAGLLSNADYTQMIRKDGTVAFTADESMGSHKLTNVTDPASAQDAATKNYTDSNIAGKAAATSITTAVTSSAGNGFVLTWNQAANNWTAVAPLSSGTVTSVGLSLPSIFTVSGSPVTSSGTLTGTLASEAQNSVFAGPSTGGAGTPTFRALASADLPTVLVAQGGTGATSLAANGILTANGSGTAVTSSFCATGQALVATSASTWGCQSVTSGSTGFINGGNSFGAASSLGNNDNFDLSVKTNNLTRLTVQAGGNVGIGTTSPAQALEINGTTKTSSAFLAGNGSLIAPAFSFGFESNTGMYLPATQSLGLVTNGTERLRISSTGNVGIGMTAPARALDVAGDIGASSAIYASAGYINRMATNGSNSANAGTPAYGFTYSADTGFFESGGAGSHALGLTTAGTERMTITSTGNVGIGTSSPGAPLEVKGAIRMSGATSGYTGFQPAAAAGSTVWTLPAADGSNNQVLTTNGSGVLAWSTPAGTGISSLNGLTTATQTFATPGTSGTAPAWVSSGSAHTLNLPLASTASVTAGLLSNADYTSFSGKMSTALTSGQIYVGNASNVATGVAPGGDVTMTNAGVFAVTKLQGNAVSATAPSTAGQALRWNGSAWAPAFVSMFDLRSIVTGSSAFGGVGCTSNQTLTWTAATDNLSCSNISLPATQVTGTLPATIGGTGQSSFAVGDLLYASSTTALSRLPAGSNGQVLTLASGIPSWGAASGGLPAPAGTAAAPGYAFSGNTNTGLFGAATNQIGLSTNGSERLRIDAIGNVGIGTTAPSATLDVKETIPGSTRGISAQNYSASGWGQISASNDNGNSVGMQSKGSTSGLGLANQGLFYATSGLMFISDSILSSGGTDAIAFRAGGYNATQEAMHISGNGNVGIGTANPTQPLHISVDTSGTATATNLTYDVFSNNANNYTPTFLGRRAEGSLSSPSAVLNYDFLASFGGSGYGATSYATSSRAAIRMQAAENWTDSAQGARMGFWVTPVGSTTRVEQVRIEASGNVGIGTTSPGTKLEVDGTSGATLKIVDGNQGAGKVLTSDSAGVASWAPAGGGRTSCSSGFTLIGTSGTAEAFCISSSQETSASWLGASTACYGKSPTKAHLCEVSEWMMSCVAGAAGPNNQGSSWEWVAGIYNGQAALMGNSTCDSNTSTSTGNSFPFRCCYH